MFEGIGALPGFPRVSAGRELTVGMAAHGNDSTTLAALESLFRSVEGDFELILVDDCSPDGGAVRRVYEAAARFHTNTQIFVFPRNLEYTGSVDAILSHASGDRILFLSNDILVAPAYVRVLLDTLEADPEIGIVRGCANFVDNGLATHNVELKRYPGSASELFAIADQFAATRGHVRLPDHFLTGDAFMTSRTVIDRIGTFDTQFYGYFPDHDFGLRARVAGFRPALAQGAFALHMEGANFHYLPPEEQARKRDRRWARVHENWARFKLKYGLPVELMYTTPSEIPWTELARASSGAGGKAIPRRDYAAYRVHGGRS
jgi:GT2 family glycosyltransferase